MYVLSSVWSEEAVVEQIIYTPLNKPTFIDKNLELKASSENHTDIIGQIINLTKGEVEEVIGDDYVGMWDSHEEEAYYCYYEDYDIAIVYELDMHEIQDNSKIEFIDIGPLVEIDGVNKMMSMDEVFGVLGETEVEDYEYWYHDSGYPTHWKKTRYVMDGYEIWQLWAGPNNNFIREFYVCPE